MSDIKKGEPQQVTVPGNAPPPYSDIDNKAPRPMDGTDQPFLPQGQAPPQGYMYQAPPQGYMYQAPPQGYGQYPQGQGYVVQGQPQAGQVIVQYPNQPGAMVTNRAAPPDYFVTSIIVTLFCFFPTGIFALLRASDARTALARGDIQEAELKSRQAKKLINISIAVGILSFVLMVALMGVYIGIVLKMSDDYKEDYD